MDFRENEFRANLYETSMSGKKNPLLSASEKTIEVYNMDKVKEWFCKEYRQKECLCSCDAYYQSQHNQLVIEFKNTHHLKLKDCWSQIQMKLLDTHMLLAETFYRSKKGSEIAKKLRALLVYNDDPLNYGPGVRKIGGCLNEIKPIKGDDSRKSNPVKLFLDEEEYHEHLDALKCKYKLDFYKDIEFMDKREFYESYIEPGNYFVGLQ